MAMVVVKDQGRDEEQEEETQGTPSVVVARAWPASPTVPSGTVGEWVIICVRAWYPCTRSGLASGQE